MAKRKSSFHTQRVTNQPLIFSMTYRLVEAGKVSNSEYQRALQRGATHLTNTGIFIERKVRVNFYVDTSL